MSKFLTSVCTYNPPTNPPTTLPNPNPKLRTPKPLTPNPKPQTPYDAKKGANLTFAMISHLKIAAA